MYCGLDLGSRNVKVALASEEGGFTLLKFETASFYRRYGYCRDGQLAVDFGAFLPEGKGPLKVVSTGYGRQAAAVAGARAIPEVKAHVLGAVHLTNLADFTLLDLGGQDSKVALVRGGRIIDFMTNDKCAASTGRYLENMAGVLGISLEELGQHYQDPVDLTSTCAIFGESELIGKMVEGYPLSSLAAGVNYSIFKRIRPMLVRLLSDTLVFTGGVAQSCALREILSRELGVKVVVPENPQYTGAIGCCVEAKFSKEGSS